MLKKSLIPAALVALSSVSAFADSESSFYLGVKGLYFMPKDEISKDFQSQWKVPGFDIKQSGGIFLPGLQFGYNVSDSIRVGLAGYFGASKFKYTIGDIAAPSGAQPQQETEETETRGTRGTRGGATTQAANNDADLRTYANKFGRPEIFNRVDSVQDISIELCPRFVLLATADMKIFESDSFSLGLGVGVGATKWKASSSAKFNTRVSQGQVNSQTVTQEFGSKWKPAFMGTVNANINLGDVAVLTGSVGYAHLGNPKGLKTSDYNGSTFDADENKAKGWIFGLGIGKEF